MKKENIISWHQYQEGKAGEIQQFIKGLPVEDAAMITVNNHEQEAMWDIPTTTNEKGCYTIKVVPGDYVVKDNEGIYSVMKSLP